MAKEIIETSAAPAPIGPYSQAVKAQGFIFTSGQLPMDVVTGEICENDITKQTHLVFKNIKAILKASGTSLDNVVKTTVFLKNMEDFAAMNIVYGEYFKDENAPARSTVEVARLPKDVLVEIDTVAVA